MESSTADHRLYTLTTTQALSLSIVQGALRAPSQFLPRLKSRVSLREFYEDPLQIRVGYQKPGDTQQPLGVRGETSPTMMEAFLAEYGLSTAGGVGLA